MKLYRYRAMSSRVYEELATGTVWYSHLAALNDPCEGLFINRTTDDSLSELIGTMAVCCFSRACDSLLMWAHYSDAHRGVCLQYEVSEEDFRTTFVKVNYEKLLPTLHELRRYPPGHPSEGCLLIDINTEGRAFSTKSKDWKYEREYRTFRFAEGPAKPPGKLTAVLFGLRSTEESVHTVSVLLRGQPDVEFKKAVLEGEFKMHFETIDRG